MCEITPLSENKYNLEALTKIYKDKCRLCLNLLSDTNVEKNENFLFSASLESSLSYYELAIQLTGMEVRYFVNYHLFNN